MKTITLILKGALLYFTVLFVLLVMMAADSLMDNGTLLYGVLIGTFFIGVCYFLISEEELKVLTFYNTINETKI